MNYSWEAQFTFYGEGKGKQRTGQAEDGHRYTQKPTKNFMACIYAASEDVKPPKPLEGPIELIVLHYHAIPKKYQKPKFIEQIKKLLLWPLKKPDFDNVEKAVADALNKVFWTDDKNVVRSFYEKKYSDVPRVEVWVREIDITVEDNRDGKK